MTGQPPLDSQRLRNIVVFSDGTGNSSARAWRTNVWRMYEAADLSTGAQLALYDNGVGTSSFRPFAVLGGALGWGLKRNVRDLYTFLCRNYRPATNREEADRIFAFGFSRGAYTIRVLIDLVEHQGLLTGASGRDLNRLAKWAYREYRRQFKTTRVLEWSRWLRDRACRLFEYRDEPYDTEKNTRNVQVTFMGLWDTVDAYGLPIDEMTLGWHKWVWPLKMCGSRPPANVTKICHAIALDDERHTFHPVLLKESQQDGGDHTDKETVTQVWFAGVHSNVGGGYPDDSLAHVSLLWMAKEACKKGLRLHPLFTRQWKARADPHGPIHDSRRGLASYYRYNPRRISRLAQDQFAGVTVARPKIHESVFQRIVAARDDYAPIVLPERYDIVTSDGTIMNNGGNPYEHSTQSSARCAAQEKIWNRVWLRRGLYFSTVGVSLAILLAPFLLKERVLGDVDVRSGSITDAVHLLGAFLPDMLQPIATYWEGHPVIFAALATSLAGLFGLSTIVQRSISDKMRKVWDAILRDGPRKVDPGSAPTDLLYRIRSHWAYRGTVESVSQHVFPLVFGLAALAAVVLIVVGSANRAAFAAVSAAGLTCPRAAEMVPTGPGEWDGIKFDNKEICQPTGVRMERGRTYEVSITLPKDWADTVSHPAALAGFGSSENPFIYVPALPFRRVLTEPWFVPVARIGRRSPEYYTLAKSTTEITPRRTGYLYLFVNDAVGIPPWHAYFYKNNVGGAASVRVMERNAVRRSPASMTAPTPRPRPARHATIGGRWGTPADDSL